MQVGNKAFINTQTVMPFTKVQRMFNMKEANSTGNCIGCQAFNSARTPIEGFANSTAIRTPSGKALVVPRNEVPDILSTKVPVTNSDGSIELTTMPTQMPSTDGPSIIQSTSPSIIQSTSPVIVTMAPTQMPTTVMPQLFPPTQMPTQVSTQMPQMPNNYVPQDFTYNSYEDWRAPTYNQWTRIYDDNCNEENRLRIGSKPMKYFVNEYNSPQVAPFMTYTVVGGQKTYDVRNDYERAIPTRLNPIYDVHVLPYNTTPFLGAANSSRTYVDTDSNLRWGTTDVKNMKSAKGNSEVDFNRWEPNVTPETVQNAGQFNSGAKLQQAMPSRNGEISADNLANNGGYYDINGQNNVIMFNSATPYFGISSRNLLHNIVDLSGC
jgi:hypothetical protein